MDELEEVVVGASVVEAAVDAGVLEATVESV